MCDSCNKLGRYNFNCLQCCARLIKDSRPSKKRQEAMFEVLAKYRNSPSREQILEELKIGN
jgi:hypothetical protein